MRFMRFSVCVNHGSTLELRTTLTEVARGAKAAAEAGRSCGGIEVLLWGCGRDDIYRTTYCSKRLEAALFGGERGASEGNKVRMKEQNEVLNLKGGPRKGRLKLRRERDE